MAKKPQSEQFEDKVERELVKALTENTGEDKIKVLAIAVRFTAIKNKIGGADDASGFDDDE